MTDSQHTLRILLIEDDDDDALITRELLEEGSVQPVELEWIENAEDGLQALREKRHDIALVDYRLGPESGVDLIKQAQMESLGTPLILLTGQGDTELDLQALEIGAADYLVKGVVDAHSLMRSIRYAIDRSTTLTSLMQSETRYRIIFDCNPVAMLLIEPGTGRVVSLNESAQKLYKVDETAIQTLSVDQLVPDQAHPSALHQADGLSTAIDVILDEHQSFDGNRLYVEVRKQPLQVDQRDLVLMMVVDVTDKVDNLRKLRLMNRAIESSSNGIVITNAVKPDMPIVYVNPAFEQITGYPSQECLGRNCRFLQQGPANDNANEKALAQIRQGLQFGHETTVVLRNYRKDGSPFWNELLISPIRDGNGEISHFIGVLNDISEKKSAESRLAYNASHDVLTGLPNRSLMEDRLVQACNMAVRYRRKVGVLLFNLDGFKPINDSLGHRVGDQLLVEISSRMQARVRNGDTVARGSSDEFIVVLPDLAQSSDILRIVEQLLADIAAPYTIENHTLRLTASVGISLDDGAIEDPLILVQQANLAMYRAKHNGRNTYHWFASDLKDEANERVELRNDLQRAQESGQLELFYQPIIEGRTGNVRGSEALIRWHHPTKGLVSPDQFIALAEDTGQIIKLGEWVLRQACSDAIRLQNMGHYEHQVSVNVSPLQLRQPNFVDLVVQSLQQTGLSPNFLELEVVESVVLYDAELVIERLLELRNIGVRIAIDDFGTGFSNLSYLKLMPATKIKIDQTFIKDVISNRNDAAITQGILSMAHHLSLDVVAEGVETHSHAAFLRRHSCQLLQGYLFAKPMPFEELCEFLSRQIENNQRYDSDDSQQRPTVLLLDDEANILKALTRLLRRDGYRILSTTSVKEAFELLAANNVQVIISDQRMPEMSGTEFLSHVKDIYPDTVRIVLSGYTDLKSVTEAINEGAIYKFLTKPWEDQNLREHIRKAFSYHDVAL
ncbi:EAL domain-containing protein [Marinobacter sp.]|uniref:EAL domain-containing protein n=1 Tax=Marinobacter sp. TaxID=50741 RepID=UPI002B279BC3|nr:EAL domain-containing protein [Marinobacter sp.]